LISKGPKYRFPSTIDFHQCKEIILESLDEYIRKWCKREHAVIDALSAWKIQIIKIMDQRIKFYQSNPSLLPKNTKLPFRFLKLKIQNFHNKFVLVPADKASNNTVIV